MTAKCYIKSSRLVVEIPGGNLSTEWKGSVSDQKIRGVSGQKTIQLNGVNSKQDY
jgi:hypothetical protein